MEILVYKHEWAEVRDGFETNDLPDLLADKDAVIWVDLLGEDLAAEDEAKALLLDVFKFHYLTVEDCIETRNQPKIEAFPDYIYCIIHGVVPGVTTSVNFATKELDIYLGPNYVVTYRKRDFRSITTVKEQIRTSTFACSRGAAYLLHQILDNMVDLYMPIVDEFDDKIGNLEDRVFGLTKSDTNVLMEVMDLRRSVSRLRRISARQLEVLYRMAHGEFPQIPASVLPFFRDVHDHLLRISDLSEGYRDLVNGLFEIHFSVVANRTNDIMKTLAVLSAIMLPLSLIAGIYGMNFENMPELHSPNGYYATLGFMAVLAALLLIYFWRRGWIFQGQEPPPPPEPNSDAEPEHNILDS